MCWIDRQPLKSVDVTEAAEQVTVLLGPRPDLSPLEVVEAMLAAFQRGENDDIEQLFNFVLPNGDLASQYQSAVGPMLSFRWTIRKEPRWKSIARRPHAALLKMRSWEILGRLVVDADQLLYRVRASPFFPDAPQAEASCDFTWQLVRQHAATSHPAAAMLVEDYADCALASASGTVHSHASLSRYSLSPSLNRPTGWLVNNIMPDFSDWRVHDPIGAGRAPDFFTPPRRSIED